MSKKTIAMKDGKPVISLKDIENVREVVLRWLNKKMKACDWDEVPYLCMFVASYMKKLGITTEVRVGFDIRGVEYCDVVLLYVTDLETPVDIFKAEFLERWNASQIVDEFIMLNEDDGNARHVAQLSKIIENACQNLANYVSKQTNVKETSKQPKTQQQ